MVYNTQEYSFFFTFPSSGILEIRKHDVSETGSVSVLRCLLPPFTGGQKQFQFPKRRVFLYLEYRTMEKSPPPKKKEILSVLTVSCFSTSVFH
jgi:hypothetical protein